MHLEDFLAHSVQVPRSRTALRAPASTCSAWYCVQRALPVAALFPKEALTTKTMNLERKHAHISFRSPTAGWGGRVFEFTGDPEEPKKGGGLKRQRLR